ncbi:hypothetical protein LQ384_23340 [Rhodococcus rhodochrous]|uniref:DUF3800 domain-containing protein n=1 Tax=Rhodococcus rhodochrous TaxID=1829 RepID=A0AAW4XMR3_RHORH|nr:hypothetical protein [Rhodococcus rhodochrous]MCD2114054.1 hypothetical protein [Rhodococcus rhodochrous]
MAPSGPLHAFIDESGRPGKNKFMLCAATVVSADISDIRARLLELRPRGSSRIHMKNAGKDAARIINGVATLEAHSYLYVVQKSCLTREARDLALTRVFEHLDDMSVRRAVIESCNQDHEDRKIIQSVLGSDPELEYVHEPAGSENPLLWIPDIHAWAWGRKGEARKAIEHRITVEVLK